ncbi:MAG: DUF4214 domain-containing protein [Iamia sp.]
MSQVRATIVRRNRIYLALFQRPADAAGLAYWVDQLESGRGLIGVATYFTKSPEFRRLYGSLDDGAFVDLLYQNVLGRAPSAEDRAYWVDQLTRRGRAFVFVSGVVGSTAGSAPTGTAPTAPAGGPAMTTTEPDTFTRMDESTAEQWAVIGKETIENQPRVAEQILAMLRQLADITDGFATDQLTHVLQAATLAERAGADEEMVFGALCHDIGKVVSVFNHPAIAAEMIQPYVRDDVYQAIRFHQDFQGRHYYAHMGKDPDARDQHVGQPWYDLAARFADEWDQVAFDPAYDTLPLEHFEPLVRRLTEMPQRF